MTTTKTEQYLNFTQSVAQLQQLFKRLARVRTQAESDIQSKSDRKVEDGLVALGLAKQAEQEMTAACQNYGFSPVVLARLEEEYGNNVPAQIEEQLHKALEGVGKLLSHKLNVSSTVVQNSLTSFVQEVTVIADYLIRRAEERLEITAVISG